MDITIGELKVDVDGTIDLRGIMGDPTVGSEGCILTLSLISRLFTPPQVPSHFNEINVKMVVETDADDAQVGLFKPTQSKIALLLLRVNNSDLNSHYPPSLRRSPRRWRHDAL